MTLVETRSDAIRVTVPARPELIHVLRSVAASMGARMELSFDAVEELRIAVDEAASLLLDDGAAAPGQLELVIEPSGMALLLAVSVRPPRSALDPAELDRSWSWRVLNGLCSDVGIDRGLDELTIRFAMSAGVVPLGDPGAG